MPALVYYFISFVFFFMHIHASIFPSFLCLSYATHNREGEKWQHEDGSEMMFDYLVRDNNILIPEKDQQFIKALIAGEPSRT